MTVPRTPRYSREVEIAKFWQRVRKTSGCWEWTAGCINGTRAGRRGVMQWRGRKVLAYRISWELEHGTPPPADKHVCHTCDNGLCVNPAHLFLGTDLDNVRDMLAKGRGSRPPLHKGATHPQVRHDDEFVKHALEQVAANGLAPLSVIAEQLGVSRGTLRDWVIGRTRSAAP